MINKKEEYSIDNFQLVEELLDADFFWINVENENKQIKKIVKGKKQKTNNILDEELRKKARRKRAAHNRLVKNQKERDLTKGLNNICGIILIHYHWTSRVYVWHR